LHLREINIDQITLENVNFYHGVYFESAPSNKSRNTINTLSINKGSFEGGSIHVDHTEIRGGFVFKNIDDCLAIIIENCQVAKISDMNYVRSKEIKFVGKDLAFEDNLNLWRLRDVKKLSFTNTRIEGDVKIIEPQISDLLNINSLKVGGMLEIVANNEVN